MRGEQPKSKCPIRSNRKDAEEFAEEVSEARPSERLALSSRPSLTVGLLTLALLRGVNSLHLDINDLAAKGAQDLLDGGVLSCGLASLFPGATLFFLR